MKSDGQIEIKLNSSHEQHPAFLDMYSELNSWTSLADSQKSVGTWRKIWLKITR